LVFMWYDAWSEGTNETYLIPALAGTGEATYPDGRTEEYRTIIPLVTDDAFEDSGPIEIMPMPAVDAVQVTPGTEPTIEPATR
ncbi:hypothetical protein KJ781_00565, partial [Patescibacteria group bacterium]|nr:hypothetical protein [Patescibacteria group bacterium]MBU1448741.1 hypothetical protein [Patescibacteria group bacterium]